MKPAPTDVAADRDEEHDALGAPAWAVALDLVVMLLVTAHVGLFMLFAFAAVATPVLELGGPRRGAFDPFLMGWCVALGAIGCVVAHHAWRGYIDERVGSLGRELKRALLVAWLGLGPGVIAGVFVNVFVGRRWLFDLAWTARIPPELASTCTGALLLGLAVLLRRHCVARS